MAIIRQIAVYDQNYNQNNHWKIDDIGVNDARNVSLSSNIRGQSNIQDALRTIDGSLSSVNTTANNKVSKTGDTMTGSLNFKGSSYSNNSATISFNDEDSSISGLTLEGFKNISNNNIYNSLSLRVNSNGEPIVDIDSNSSSSVDSAWRNAIKAFGKYGDQAHYGSISIQPDPNSTDPDDSLFPFAPDREDWSGIYWKDKDNVEMGLINSYSHPRTDNNDIIIPQENGIKINSKWSGNYYGGENILKIGVTAGGDPTVNISATSYDNLTNPITELDKTSAAQEAWRKAITGSSKIARMMNVALTTSTTPNDENIPANSYHEFKLEAPLPSATDYDWTTCIGPIQAWVHSNQDKLIVLYYSTAIENNKIMLTAKVKNLTNNNLSDKVTWKVLWFALYNGTDNV